MLNHQCAIRGCKVTFGLDSYTDEQHSPGCPFWEPTEVDNQLELPLKPRTPLLRYPKDEAPLQKSIEGRSDVWAKEFRKMRLPANELPINLDPFAQAMRHIEKSARRMALSMQQITKPYRLQREARRNITTSYAPTLGPGRDI